MKSKCTPDLEVFTGKEFSIENNYKRFETFEIDLKPKMTLNLDRIPTPEVHIAYTFSHISGTAQGYITPKILAKYY